MEVHIPEPAVSKLFFSNTRMSWLWLIVRVYVGWQWLNAGWEKFHSPTWTGNGAGTALGGFINGALAKASGAHPDVQAWYATFLHSTVLPHLSTWSYAIVYGEMIVGAALIIGLLTGIAAFFGLFMNLNYMLAGTVSTNPILFTIAIGIILAWRIAGYIGFDRFILPLFISGHPRR